VEEEILDVQPDSHRNAAPYICGIMMFEGDRALKKVSVLSGGRKAGCFWEAIVQSRQPASSGRAHHHLDNGIRRFTCLSFEQFEGRSVIVTHSEMILQCRYPQGLSYLTIGRVKVFEGTTRTFLRETAGKMRAWRRYSSKQNGYRKGEGTDQERVEKDEG